MSDDGKDTELGRRIDMMIRQSGPMSLHAYIELCLTHPTLGYYKKAHPIGAAGDFITAPEISQMFGELLGVWLSQAVADLHPGKAIELVELGPGRGTLVADILRVFKGENATLTLFETSDTLIAEQRRRLGAHHPRWAGHVEEIATDGPPLFIVANEFFDALPIRQYQKAADGWHEREIGLVDGRRAFGLSPTAIPDTALPEAVRGAPAGARWEHAPAAARLFAALTGRIAVRGGAMLVIDYGYDRTRTGDTLQAMRRHAYADPLLAPGETDLTAHVDFQALAASAAPRTIAHPLIAQGAFLAAMGIDARAEALVAANPARAEAIFAERDRLIGNEAMGGLFRVLCVSPKGTTPYPFAGA